MKQVTQYKVVRLFPEPRVGRCVETEQIEQALNNNAKEGKEGWELFSMEERSTGNFPEVVSVMIVLSKKTVI